MYLKDNVPESCPVEFSVVMKDSLAKFILDRPPGSPPGLHDAPGHGVGVDDGDAEVPEHVGDRALARGHPALQHPGGHLCEHHQYLQ